MRVSPVECLSNPSPGQTFESTARTILTWYFRASWFNPGPAYTVKDMARFSISRLIFCCALAAATFSTSGCSRDPNVRKLKYFRSGQQYLERGKYSEAAVQFLNATRIDPTYSEAHYQLGQSYLKMQQWSPAYQEFARTADLDPDNLEVRLELTKLLIASNNLPQAQEQVDLLLKKWPNQWQAHMVASTLLTARNNLADAIAEMQKAITLEPGRSDSYLTLGILQQKNNQPEAAEGSFKNLHRIHPTSRGNSHFGPVSFRSPVSARC
jgi:tetratricopeptide (TPR) repeat protein